MNILISAFIGSENLGDKAIFKSILDNLGVDKSQVTAVTINEARTHKAGVKTAFAKNPRNIVRAIKECDVFLVGGGGIIQDQSSLLNFLYYAFQLGVAKHYKKPTILTFVGVGPVNYRLSRFLLKRVTKDLSMAVVRDEKSRQLLAKHIDDPDKIISVHDSVLNFAFDERKLPPSPFMDKQPYVAVSLRRWFFTKSLLPVFMTRKLNKLPMFRKKYEAFVADVAHDLDVFLGQHPKITLVLTSFYDSEDIEVLNDVRGLMQHKERTVFAKRELSELEYLAIVKHAEFLMGMRLHSLILASLVAKPFVALRYSPKVDEFTEQLGLTDYSVHVERYSSKKLQAGLAAMTKDAARLEKKMPKVVTQYRKKNQEAFDAIRKKLAVLEKQTKSR